MICKNSLNWTAGRRHKWNLWKGHVHNCCWQKLNRIFKAVRSLKMARCSKLLITKLFTIKCHLAINRGLCTWTWMMLLPVFSWTKCIIGSSFMALWPLVLTNTVLPLLCLVIRACYDHLMMSHRKGSISAWISLSANHSGAHQELNQWSCLWNSPLSLLLAFRNKEPWESTHLPYSPNRVSLVTFSTHE